MVCIIYTKQNVQIRSVESGEIYTNLTQSNIPSYHEQKYNMKETFSSPRKLSHFLS